MSDAKPLSRAEREAQIKDKAGWIITVIAALLAINTLLGGGNSSMVLNNTIAANDTWGFYQAKSIKQTAYEIAAAEAEVRGDMKRFDEYKARVDRYESDPATGEGKKELMAKAHFLEAERAVAKKRSPWYTYAGSLYQIAIVLLTASILAVNIRLLWASLAVGSSGALFMSQAVWLWLPF